MAYFILRKRGIGARDVIRLVKTLQRKLEPVASRYQVRISFRGHPCVLVHDKGNGLVDVEFGEPCEVPRDIKKALSTAVLDKKMIERLNLEL